MQKKLENHVSDRLSRLRGVMDAGQTHRIAANFDEKDLRVIAKERRISLQPFWPVLCFCVGLENKISKNPGDVPDFPLFEQD
jgi:hypothetical protein